MPPLRFPDWIISSFNVLNARHFQGSLSHPVFALAPSESDKCAWYGNQSGIAFIGVTSECVNRGAEFVADSLLHQMVDHALATRRGLDTESHGEAFAALANTIGSQMGLPPVAAATDEAERWPHSVRPAAHDRRAVASAVA
jgi:hypothetical protein